MESNTYFKYGVCVRANCRIPLIHMSNRRIYIEETNQNINKFSFAYMLNPHLTLTKLLKIK